jgi:hypothetical protein
MAKVKIELDLDWMNEDGSIEELIKDELISSLQAKFTAKAEKKMEEMMNEKLEGVAAKISDDFLEKIMSERIENLQIPFKESQWGSEIKLLPMSEFVGARYERFLNTKVYDKDGNKAKYESDAKVSINEFFINRYLEKELVGKVNNLISKARQDAEETVIKTLESNLKSQLSADIINRLNIPSMLKSLQEKAALFEGEAKV